MARKYMMCFLLAVMTGGGPILGPAGAVIAESGHPPLGPVSGAPYPPHIIFLTVAEDLADEADAIGRRADDLAEQAADVAESCAEAVGESCIEINNRNDNRNQLRNIDRNRIGGVAVFPTPEPTSTALRVNPAAARLALGASAGGAVFGSTVEAGLITAEARRIVAEAKRIVPEAGRIAGEAGHIVGLANGVDPKAEQVASGAVGRAEAAKKKASEAGRIALQVARTPLGKNAVEDDDCRDGDCENEAVSNDCGNGGRSCGAGESLPFTGAPTTAFAGLGVGLLVAGAGVLWLVRRRRSIGAK
ncbi:LPXTG cell wall anchor domain-containing protein [Streptosporangium sp. NPDC000509]|uniref:LPXTG cell wall anchor domain-containing protein n=1 Tax=Streptosporangium sp. NPDC000509 TaxID=3366186 RepID=UPI003683317A